MGTTKYPSVCTITLSFNRKNDTIACIDSLKRMTYPNYTIMVVENGSTDGSGKAIRDRFPDVDLIEINKNVGYSGGFNAGMDCAYKKGADFFLILNNDTIIDPNALTALVEAASTDERIGFVSGKVLYYHEPRKIQSAGRNDHPIYLVGGHVGMDEYDSGKYDEVKEYSFVDDVFLLVRREVYERIGGYDEDFFLQWEETDWCARVRRGGFRIIYTPMAKIWHKGNLTMSSGLSPTVYYYNIRNRFLFMWKNGSSRQFRKTLVYLFGKELPMTIARLVRHSRYSYLCAYLHGILSGLHWIVARK